MSGTMAGMDIAEFLTARYDEEQQLAEDAKRGRNGIWEASANRLGEHRVHDDLGYDVVADSDVDSEPWWTVPHIAYWDPARVLADIAAKRKLVELHAPHPNGTCDACARWTDVFECYHVQHPCPTLKVLAAPYADHPDYDPAWTVPPRE